MKLSFEELGKLQPDKGRQLTPEEQKEMLLELERRAERDKDNPFFFSGWEGDTFIQKLVVNEVTVRQYLKDCIEFWRNDGAHYASYCAGAFQSAYDAIFEGIYPGR